MLLYWIWYAQLKKLNCAQKKMLLEHFCDPEEIYFSGEAVFAKVPDITRPMLDALEDKDLSGARRILELCQDKGISLVTFADSGYPQKLKNIYDSPMVLYYRGKLPAWESQPVIGIVGTRKASATGMRSARKYGGQIAACGGLVVSGGAAGGDTMALEGALETGKPVACVFGCGVDVYYPAANRKLFEQIAVQGCLLSEYPPKTEANSWHFPQRNRILSGLSNGVLVVEAPLRSGALITARLAMEQGRDVYVIPGNVEETACAGSNALLQEYGVAALSGWDAVKEYQPAYPGTVARREAAVVQPAVPEPVKPAVPAEPDKKSVDKKEKSTYSVVHTPGISLNPQEQTVYETIDRPGITTDEVIDKTGLPAGKVKAILTKLAVKGCIQQDPGGHISRK